MMLVPERARRRHYACRQAIDGSSHHTRTYAGVSPMDHAGIISRLLHTTVASPPTGTSSQQQQQLLRAAAWLAALLPRYEEEVVVRTQHAAAA